MESKRYEPYRAGSKKGAFSEAYWRPVWGANMTAFERVRDALHGGDRELEGLNAAQLVKHAFGLVTESGRRNPRKEPVLVYLYAAPRRRPDGALIPEAVRTKHTGALERFRLAVANQAVQFIALNYDTLLEQWSRSDAEDVARHAAAVRERFEIRPSAR